LLKKENVEIFADNPLENINKILDAENKKLKLDL